MGDEILTLLDYVEAMGLHSLCRGRGHYVITDSPKGSSHTALNVTHRGKSWEIRYTVAPHEVHEVVVPEGQLMLQGVPEVRGYLSFLQT